MTPVTTIVRPSYFVRLAVTGGIFAFIGTILALVSRGRLALIAVGVVPFLIWAAVMIWTHLHGTRLIDSHGITRRDGKRFLWTDLIERRDVHTRMPWTAQGPLNNIDLLFSNGKLSVFPHTFENADEVLDAVARMTLPQARIHIISATFDNRRKG